MPRPRSKKEVKNKLCCGCYDNRYNCPGLCERPGIDAVVTSNYCWHNDPAKALYCRPLKEWVMPCHSGKRERWVVRCAEAGKRLECDWMMR